MISIHNNSVAAWYKAESLESGFLQAKVLAEAKLNRKLTDDEQKGLKETQEIYNEDDSDNVWCISVNEIDS